MLRLRFLEMFARFNYVSLGTKIVFKDANGNEHEINNIQYVVQSDDNKIVLSEEAGNLTKLEA